MKNLYHSEPGVKIYNQDNLELLRELPSESINLIYCDILYNTGKKFDDYNDDLGDPTEATKWYRPRIEEMKRVLTNNGSIFIHCNWRLDSYIRILMDEIFGANCFRNRIYRQHSEKRGFYANFDSQVDIILYYVKNPNDFVFNEIHTDRARIVPLYENGLLEGRDDIRYVEELEIDVKKFGKHWIVTKSQFEQMKERGEVQVIEGLPYRFTDVQPVGNLWTEPNMLDKYSRTETAEAYDTPKPEAVLDRIIRIASNEDDTVADFFLGGGTTAVVARRLNRRGIYCDINPEACDVTINKIHFMR